MPKILWVALPLLLAAAFLALQLLRGRAPSRTAINIVSSVLLLAYVATTASLGIFWVANQQLPVFDWHYLFGYGTVLLVSLHLVFNFPTVWRWFARRAERDREASPALGPAAAGATRRGLLTTLGVLAATGAAFVLGLRHGRSELKVEAAAGGSSPPTAGATAGAGGGDASTALALIERFHAFSTHTRAGLLTRSPSGGWGEPPPPFKRHAGASREPLPAPATARAGRLDLASLGALLWHTAGVTENRGGLALRASPSSGALFATELYLLARPLPGLAAGVLHYDPEAHALERLGAASPDALPAGALEDGAAGAAPVLLVATAIFERSGHKYRDRTYRYVLADLGHALENLRVAAGALGLPARFVNAFDEARLARVLGVDEAEEGVLSVIALGPSSAATRRRRPGAALADRDAGATGLRALRRGTSAVTSPEVTASVHAATSLRALTQALPAAATNAAPPPAASATAAALVALPTTELVASDWLRLIAARRSVRRYADAPLRLADLAAVLARMAAEAGPRLSTAVRIDVVVHAVDGLGPGAYRYRPADHALLHRRRLASSDRAATRAAALDQDVIGDAAAVFVLSIDRAAFAADPLGPARGYRHAFLEAGRVGERIYLEAAARGLGACAVGAFYDDEAAALVGVDPAREWVVHFAALGVRA
jgi:SagB-type dehydrogenase family enzyme